MIDLKTVNWYDNSVTKKYVEEHADALVDPSKMTAGQLANTITYCDGIFNPYSHELCRRTGNLQTFQRAADATTANGIVQKSARTFGIWLE